MKNKKLPVIKNQEKNKMKITGKKVIVNKGIKKTPETKIEKPKVSVAVAVKAKKPLSVVEKVEAVIKSKEPEKPKPKPTQKEISQKKVVVGKVKEEKKSLDKKTIVEKIENKKPNEIKAEEAAVTTLRLVSSDYIEKWKNYQNALKELTKILEENESEFNKSALHYLYIIKRFL